jgi:hypothetical protein
MTNGKLMTQEEYLQEEAHEAQMQREFEEWSEDDFCFPWMDYVSSCNIGTNEAFRAQILMVI